MSRERVNFILKKMKGDQHGHNAHKEKHGAPSHLTVLNIQCSGGVSVLECSVSHGLITEA